MRMQYLALQRRVMGEKHIRLGIAFEHVGRDFLAPLARDLRPPHHMDIGAAVARKHGDGVDHRFICCAFLAHHIDGLAAPDAGAVKDAILDTPFQIAGHQLSPK